MKSIVRTVTNEDRKYYFVNTTLGEHCPYGGCQHLTDRLLEAGVTVGRRSIAGSWCDFSSMSIDYHSPFTLKTCSPESLEI